MSKRRLEGDIDDLSEEVLSDLDSDKRMRLALTAMAEGNRQWIDRLRESCSTDRYVMTDPQYTKRVEHAMQFGHHAVYELATTLMLVEHLYYQQRAQFVIDHLSDEPPDEEALAAARDRADELKNSVVDLYSRYYGYQQFAEEELGMALEDWLGFHYEADMILAGVESFLDEQEILVEAAADRFEDLTLDDLADAYYRSLAEEWAEIVDGIDG